MPIDLWVLGFGVHQNCHSPKSSHIQYGFGGSCVNLKGVLFRFVEGQNQFGMPRGAKMSLARNRLLFLQIKTLSPSMRHKWKEIFDILRQNNQYLREDHSREKSHCSTESLNLLLVHHYGEYIERT